MMKRLKKPTNCKLTFKVSLIASEITLQKMIVNCVWLCWYLSVYWFLCSPNLLLRCLLYVRLGSSNNLMIFCSSLRFVLCPKRPGKGNITSLHTKTSCNCTVLSNVDISRICIVHIKERIPWNNNLTPTWFCIMIWSPKFVWTDE